MVRLVHVANNLCKDLGLGYLLGEQPEYDVDVLEALRIDQGRLEVLRERLAADVVDEISGDGRSVYVAAKACDYSPVHPETLS